MKKTVLIAAVLAFTAPSFAPSNATAGEAYQNYSRDSSVMGVGQTTMDVGASARAHSEKVISSSRADLARNYSVGVNTDLQFGQSQTEQSWKSVKSPEKSPVVGLVAGDCRGDNTSDAYRKQMGQNRDGYTKEHTVSQKDCEFDHATVGGTGAPAAAH